MLIISMEDLPLKKIVKKIILLTASYSSKNLIVKDGDEELSEAIMGAMKSEKALMKTMKPLTEFNQPIKHL